jgi:C_GCAxxG_C_C family probable redox protein
MTKSELAESLFKSGLNCSQAVAVAFADEMNMSKDMAERLTVGFGGGMGRMREVCGAVSGMTFVLSAIYVNDDKAKIYERVQTVANEFRQENGSIVCRELLGLATKGADLPTPQARTEGYYKKRPCSQLVAMSADILDRYIKSNPV